MTDYPFMGLVLI